MSNQYYCWVCWKTGRTSPSNEFFSMCGWRVNKRNEAGSQGEAWGSSVEWSDKLRRVIGECGGNCWMWCKKVIKVGSRRPTGNNFTISAVCFLQKDWREAGNKNAPWDWCFCHHTRKSKQTKEREERTIRWSSKRLWEVEIRKAEGTHVKHPNYTMQGSQGNSWSWVADDLLKRQHFSVLWSDGAADEPVGVDSLTSRSEKSWVIRYKVTTKKQVWFKKFLWMKQSRSGLFAVKKTLQNAYLKKKYFKTFLKVTPTRCNIKHYLIHIYFRCKKNYKKS